MKIDELISSFKFQFSSKDIFRAIISLVSLLIIGGGIFVLGRSLSFSYNFEPRHKYIFNQSQSNMNLTCADNKCFQQVNKFPLTLSWKLPSDFAQGEIDFMYKPAKDSNLEIYFSNSKRAYTLENATLEKIINNPFYTVFQTQNYYLIQKQPRYNSWQDFLAKPPTTGTIGILGLRLSDLKHDIAKITPPAISLIASDAFNQDIYFKITNGQPYVFKLIEKKTDERPVFYISDTEKNVLYYQSVEGDSITITDSQLKINQVYRLHWLKTFTGKISCQTKNLICETMTAPEGDLANQYFRNQADQQIVNIANLTEDQILSLDYILAYYDPPRIYDNGWHQKTIRFPMPIKEETITISSSLPNQPMSIDSLTFRFIHGQLDNQLMDWFNRAAEKLQSENSTFDE